MTWKTVNFECLFFFQGKDQIDSENAACCAICLDDFADGDSLKVLQCKHEFHDACISPWVEKKSSLCPLCKQDALPNVDQVTGSSNSSFDHLMRSLDNFAQNIAQGIFILFYACYGQSSLF